LVDCFWESDKFALCLTKLSMDYKMSGRGILGIVETEEGRKIEINFERVISWTLLFTNAFFISYFFVKLFQWV
jgi:hypothetical protein